MSSGQENQAPKGHVVFVGAGPGDPDLLTVKALRALQAADVVIHDRLVSSDILDLSNSEALLLDAGKQGFGPAMQQDDINALIGQFNGIALFIDDKIEVIGNLMHVLAVVLHVVIFRLQHQGFITLLTQQLD